MNENITVLNSYLLSFLQHKVIWMGNPMRLELTHKGLIVQFANHYTTWGARHNSKSNSLNFLCLDAVQGHMNGAPNETRTYSWRCDSSAW